MSVNKPMDTKQRDIDIARKLQVYGIASGFRAGKLPSNDQVDVALNSFLATKGINQPSNKLSEEGRVLVNDFADVVRAAKNLILSKNSGDLLQDFIYQTSNFDTNAVSSVNTPVGKDKAKRDGNEAVEGLRTLGRLILTNGQFRKLLKDATILLRDVAGDAATNAAGRVRPSDEQLSEIDSPADDNTWHDTPDLSRDKLKQQAGRFYGGDAKKDAKDVLNAGHQARGDNNQSVVGSAINAAQHKVDANVDENDKDKVRQNKEELRRKTREYYNKKMPKERKDQTIWRLKKMVLECQQHKDYMRAVQTLLNLAEQYGSHGKQVTGDASGTAKDTRNNLAQAETSLKTLIERFANGTSSDDLWAAINQVYKDADNDHELKDWFRSMDRYIRRCLLEHGYILNDDSTTDWDRLYSQGRYLLRDKYRSHTDRILDEVKFLGEQFDHDAQNLAFRASLEKLFNDLGHDSNGQAAFKPHLVKDLTEVIFPAVLSSISYVPIPRIEYSDPMVDLVVENLVIQSDNFMPNVASIYSENYFKWGRVTTSNSHKQTFEVVVKGIQLDMRDVSYYVRKKQGFPSITDQGMMDIMLPHDGFGFKVRMSSADPKDSQRFFKIEKVDVDLKNLKLKFTKSKHKLLLSIVKPLALRIAQPIIKKVVEQTIKDQADNLDQIMYDIQKEAESAKEQVYEDPSAAPTIYQRYLTAAKERFNKNKKKAEDKVADKKMNVALTNNKSIFPNIDLPGGVSTKATEYQDLAKQGEHWKSPVFSIGSAAKSTDIPAAPRIERKSHPVTSFDHHGESLAGSHHQTGVHTGINSGRDDGHYGHNSGHLGNNQSLGYGNGNNTGYNTNTSGFANGNATSYANGNPAGYANGNVGKGPEYSQGNDYANSGVNYPGSTGAGQVGLNNPPTVL